MLKNLMSKVWRGAPKSVRRWGVWLAQPRFFVTAGAVVEDERGRILLLKHVFRVGSGWGIPGGFIKKAENAEDALRRELREEIGIEIESAELAFTRTLPRPQQVEIIFRCRTPAAALARDARSFEVKRAEWFERDELPAELGRDQRRLIERALANRAMRAE